MNKPEFIVSIGVNFSDVLTGGILVLHKLAYEIARRGYKVTIFTTPEYPHENIVVQNNSSENNLNFTYDLKNTVIIPSFDWKNNSDLIYVARWALYHITDSYMVNVEETDEVFNFGTFNIPTDKVVNKLTVLDYHLDLYKNQNRDRIGKYCHLFLKNTPTDAEEIIKQLNSFDISDYKSRGCFEYLAQVFNEYEYFLTFDDKTFHTVAASMCGCKSIILGEKNIIPEEFRKQNPIQKYGVAYGFDDLNWAEETIDLVTNNIKNLIESDNKSIQDFIDFWINRINSQNKN
jgi:hypothetical protein